MSENSSSKPAWVQLYEARRLTGPAVTRNPGRPPAAIPRRKVGLTLSKGEIVELEVWQERLSALLDRKISAGETAGILLRICSGRLTHLPPETHFDSLEALVEWMVGKE